ncbi:MAG: electron transport complex subunit RsxE [Clostridiales bacterium]|jgi:electron transport complex protein RnfE|nr:electron transport complex subunit RsxE [Clostridiales bacterium]
MNKLKETALGGILQNPTFVLVLGMCPTIAMSNSFTNAIVMALSTLVVLVLSNVFISLLRNVIPDVIRIPCYIIVIATLVTVVDLSLQKFLPSVYPAIGQFVKLIVVNCIILGRAEAFAAKNTVGYAALDGVSIGLGFVVSMALLGGVRELLAKVLGLAVFGQTIGGFVTLAVFMAAFNLVMDAVSYKKAGKNQLLVHEEAVA